MAEPLENTFINPFVYPLHFATLLNSFIRAFRTLSILLIPSNSLRLSICTALILHFSFSFHNILTAIRKNRYKQYLMQIPSIN